MKILLLSLSLVSVLIGYQIYLPDLKWFRKLKGGTWCLIWYQPGDDVCWVNYHVDESEQMIIIKTENYL